MCVCDILTGRLGGCKMNTKAYRQSPTAAVCVKKE